MLKEVTATRYVTPLREGGSLPGLVEADDLGLYVMKFTGAGQGRKTLVAEVVCGELARRLGLRVPRLVTLGLDPVLGLGEPEQQVQDLLRASAGTNLGMDFLSGALGFDPLAFPVDSAEAGRIVWFDALINNVDRSWRNPNLLVHRGELWLIDHGATMIWHHNWPGAAASAARPYDASDHALARCAPDVAGAAAALAPLVTEELLAEVTAEIPDVWLADEPGFETPDDLRRAYARPLLDRAPLVHERVTGIGTETSGREGTGTEASGREGTGTGASGREGTRTHTRTGTQEGK
ncbi:HipA family kinase [Streptomyces mangrovisoli]|uniref:HipA family kinase n=1 Tax=Streptomyces mangrovisoli TaxID=1428628 RepID=UPI000B07CD4D|nr:HipA family kinase [Streptomyces mangrovisoli]